MDGEGCWVNSFKVDYSLDGEYWWNHLDYQDDPSQPIVSQSSLFLLYLLYFFFIYRT